MRRLSPTVWTGAFAAYAYAATVISAAWFLRRIEHEGGHTLGVATSLEWQALIYGAWIPVGAAIWLVFRRWDLRVPAALATLALCLVATPGHALFAAAVDEAFSPGRAGDLAGRVYRRLPIDLLVFTALAAAAAASHLQRRAATLTAALASARQAQARPPEPQAEPPARLMVSTGAKRTLVDLAEVEWFASAGNYVVVHWDGREGLIRETLQALGERLDPRIFARSHRSAIVNLGKVAQASALSDGSWRLITQSGADLVASRTYRDAILKRLGRQ